MTYQFETVNLLRSRGEVVPEDVDANALIFCAPRPLLGTKTWQGDWVAGRFFAAVNLDDPYRAGWIKENKALHAALLTFVSDEQGQAMVRAYLHAEYGATAEEITSDVFAEFWRDSFYDQFGRGVADICVDAC